MCQFLTLPILQLPEVSKYDVILRLDSDSFIPGAVHRNCRTYLLDLRCFLTQLLQIRYAVTRSKNFPLANAPTPTSGLDSNTLACCAACLRRSAKSWARGQGWCSRGFGKVFWIRTVLTMATFSTTISKCELYRVASFSSSPMLRHVTSRCSGCV
jgi:hypothetical protein